MHFWFGSREQASAVKDTESPDTSVSFLSGQEDTRQKRDNDRTRTVLSRRRLVEWLKLCDYKIHHFVDTLIGKQNCELSPFLKNCTNHASNWFEMNYFKIVFSQKSTNFSRYAGFYKLQDVTHHVSKDFNDGLMSLGYATSLFWGIPLYPLFVYRFIHNQFLSGNMRIKW